MFLWLIVRAYELFTDVQWRMYAAAVIGRNGLRNPFGARRALAMASGAIGRVAKNDSKARALLVNVQLLSGAGGTIFSSSLSVGTTDFAIDWGDPNASPAGQLFVLAPDDELFAQNPSAFPMILAIGQEWY